MLARLSLNKCFRQPSVDGYILQNGRLSPLFARSLHNFGIKPVGTGSVTNDRRPPLLRPVSVLKHRLPDELYSSIRCFSSAFSLANSSAPVQPNTSTEEHVPSFRDRVGVSNDVQPFAQSMPRPRIRKQIMFFGFTSFFAFLLAGAITNVITEDLYEQFMQSSFLPTSPPTSTDMRRARQIDLGNELKATLQRLKDSKLPLALKGLVVQAYATTAQAWLDTTEPQRMAWILCMVNVGVYLAWKVPALRPFMNRSFTHHPLSGKAYTMFTSMFSHESLWHLGFNCMALSSFGAGVGFILTKWSEKNSFPEATSAHHLWAFFISAGLFSALVSHTAATKITFPRLVKLLSSPSAAATAPVVPEILPSLGSSGAIYAFVILTALSMPHVDVIIPFLPFIPIPITGAVGSMVLMDAIGVVRGWRVFDHYAHLGGAAAGGLYYYLGHRIWTWMREASFEDEEDSENEEEHDHEFEKSQEDGAGSKE